MRSLASQPCYLPLHRLARVPDWAILHVILNAGCGGQVQGTYLDWSIGALTERDASGIAHHVRWSGGRLSVGSRIVVSVVETDQPDPPTKRYRSDKAVQENPFTEEELKEMRRQDYLELKKEFEPQR